MDGTNLQPGGVKIIVNRITGALQPSQEELNEKVSAIHTAGLQV